MSAARSILGLLLVCLFIPEFAAADRLLGKEINAALPPKVRDTVGIAVVDVQSGQLLYGLHEDRQLKPASVLKVITSAVALRELGPEYTFQTAVYAVGRNGSRARELIIRGGGDPTLTLESAWLLARKIRAAGIRQIGTLLLDTTRYQTPRQRVGTRAYESGSSALSFNFNSVGIEICPTTSGQAARVSIEPFELAAALRGSVRTVGTGNPVYSVEDQTQCDRDHCDFAYALEGQVHQASGCEVHYRSVERPELYFGQTFQRMLQSLGITVEGNPGFGNAGSDATLVATHASKPLRLVLQDLNHYSNNFLAEQVIFALGEGPDGQFSHARGIERVAEVLNEWGISRERFEIRDGSGLSHDNRMTPLAVATVMRGEARRQFTSVEYVASLPVWGRSGTLRKRGDAESVPVRGKTGSLDGVSTLAGYVVNSRGRQIAFCILQNGVASKPQAVKIEDTVVEVISRIYQ